MDDNTKNTAQTDPIADVTSDVVSTPDEQTQQEEAVVEHKIEELEESAP